MTVFGNSSFDKLRMSGLTALFIILKQTHLAEQRGYLVGEWDEVC